MKKNTGYNSIRVEDIENGNFDDLGALLIKDSAYSGVIQFNAFEVPDGSFEVLNSIIDPAIGVENSFYEDWTPFNTCHNFMQDMAAVVGLNIDSLDGFAATPSGSAASLFSNSGGTLFDPSLGISIQFDENGQNSFLGAIESGDLTISQSLDLLGQWALTYDDLPSANSIISGFTSLALVDNSGDLAALETTLASLAEKYPELATHPEFLSRVAPALQALGGQDAWGRFLNDHLLGNRELSDTLNLFDVDLGEVNEDDSGVVIAALSHSIETVLEDPNAISDAGYVRTLLNDLHEYPELAVDLLVKVQALYGTGNGITGGVGYDFRFDQDLSSFTDDEIIGGGVNKAGNTFTILAGDIRPAVSAAAVFNYSEDDLVKGQINGASDTHALDDLAENHSFLRPVDDRTLHFGLGGYSTQTQMSDTLLSFGLTQPSNRLVFLE